MLYGGSLGRGDVSEVVLGYGPGTGMLVVYPGVNQATIGPVKRVSTVLGAPWCISATVGGTSSSVDFSIGYDAIP